MREQAEAFVRHVKDSALKADIVTHDHDGKFTEEFDQTLRDADLQVKKAACRSPGAAEAVPIHEG